MLVGSAVYTTVCSFVLFSELNVAAKVVGIEDRFDFLKAVPGENDDRRHRRLSKRQRCTFITFIRSLKSATGRCSRRSSYRTMAARQSFPEILLSGFALVNSS
jgi:hypothetical protein